MLGIKPKRTNLAVMVYQDTDISEVPWSLAGILEVFKGHITAIDGEYVHNGQTPDEYYARLTDKFGYGRVVINELPNPVR
jgi:hypothetical protein